MVNMGWTGDTLQADVDTGEPAQVNISWIGCTDGGLSS